LPGGEHLGGDVSPVEAAVWGDGSEPGASAERVGEGKRRCEVES